MLSAASAPQKFADDLNEQARQKYMLGRPTAENALNHLKQTAEENGLVAQNPAGSPIVCRSPKGFIYCRVVCESAAFELNNFAGLGFYVDTPPLSVYEAVNNEPSIQ